MIQNYSINKRTQLEKFFTASTGPENEAWIGSEQMRIKEQDCRRISSQIQTRKIQQSFRRTILL